MLKIYFGRFMLIIIMLIILYVPWLSLLQEPFFRRQYSFSNENRAPSFSDGASADMSSWPYIFTSLRSNSNSCLLLPCVHTDTVFPTRQRSYYIRIKKSSQAPYLRWFEGLRNKIQYLENKNFFVPYVVSPSAENSGTFLTFLSTICGFLCG